MKFEDIEFKKHSILAWCKHALLKTENGYLISIVGGFNPIVKGNGEETYEVGIKRLPENTLLDDIKTYEDQSKEQVMEILGKVDNLKS